MSKLKLLKTLDQVIKSR